MKLDQNEDQDTSQNQNEGQMSDESPVYHDVNKEKQDEEEENKS